MQTGKALINDIDNFKLKQGQLVFWWLGQSGFVIKGGNKVIYIDAFLSDLPGRNVPPLLKPEEIVNADFILGTHEHGDHIDLRVWKQLSLSNPNAKFVVPMILIDKIAAKLDIPKERFLGLNDGVSADIDGLKITGIASAHEFLDKDSATGLYPYLGYILEIDGRTIYHSGDTCNYEGLTTKLLAYEKIDLMIVPINGRSAFQLNNGFIGNMTYQEAVDLAGTVKPLLAVPSHYEMITMNSENPKLFTDYMDVKYPGQKFWVGEHGEAVTV